MSVRFQSLASRVIVGCSLALVAATSTAVAGTIQQSTRNYTPGNSVGGGFDPINYNALAQANNNNGGTGWVIVGSDYADFFDASNTIEWNNVAVPALTSGQALVVQSRRGNNDGPQGYKVDLFTPGSGYGTPVATLFGASYRRTDWSGTAANDFNWTHAPLSVVSGSYTSGSNYDVRITSQNSGNSGNAELGSNAGSHLRSFGVRTYDTLGAVNVPKTFEITSFAFANFSNRNGVAQDANSVGLWLDNVTNGNLGTLTGDWIDYQIFNDSATPSIADVSAFVRHGTGSDRTLGVINVDQYGNLSLLTSIVIPSTGWQGTNFFDRTAAGSITLQPGLNTLRFISDGPIHIDSFTLTVIPEPMTLGLATAIASTLLLRRRQIV
jgi:hypothetical protein